MRRHPTKYLTTLLLLVTTMIGSVMASSQQDSFAAHYSLTRNDVEMGKIKRTLRQLDDGSYLYESSSRTIGFVSWFIKDRIVERSTWRYVNNRPRPIKYSYDRTEGKKERHAELSFNWDKGIVTNNINNDPWRMPVPPETLDKLLYQITLMMDLKDGNKDIEYQIADGGKLKQYQFTVTGEEQILTKMGRLQAIKLQRINDKRQTTIWSAPAFDYLPVRIEQTDKDGGQLAINIEKVIGLPTAPPQAQKNAN